MRSQGSRVLETIICWDGDLLLHRTLSPGQCLTIGPRAGTDIVVSEQIAPATVELVRVQDQGLTVWLPAGATCTAVAESGLVDSLVGEGRCTTLPAHSTVETQIGELSILLRWSDSPPVVRTRGALDWRAQRGTAVSAGLHLLLLLLVAAVPPDGFALAMDRQDGDSRFLPMLIKPPESQLPKWLQRSAVEPAGEKAAPGKQGKMGRPDAARTQKRFGVKGTDHRTQPAGAVNVMDYGALKIIRQSQVTGLLLDAKQSALGADAEQAMGGIQGDAVGPDYGVNGLGIEGTGRHGGGTCDGPEEDCRLVTVGRLDTRGPGGSGWGTRPARLPGRKVTVPRVFAVRAAVRGALSKDIVRRVVRRHINEIRFCVQQAVTPGASLSGRVVISFVIQGNGTVGVSKVHSSTLGNHGVEQCMTQAVRRWSFPAPQGGGLVHVNYPFVVRVADGG